MAQTECRGGIQIMRQKRKNETLRISALGRKPQREKEKTEQLNVRGSVRKRVKMRQGQKIRAVSVHTKHEKIPKDRETVRQRV